MYELQYMAEKQEEARQAALPAMERRARLSRELTLLRQEQRQARRPRVATRWLGNQMVNLGDRLARTGERLSTWSATPSPEA